MKTQVISRSNAVLTSAKRILDGSERSTSYRISSKVSSDPLFFFCFFKSLLIRRNNALLDI